MLNDLEKLNLKPTPSMYNAILGGYFKEVVSCDSLDAFAIFFFSLVFLWKFVKLTVLLHY